MCATSWANTTAVRVHGIVSLLSTRFRVSTLGAKGKIQAIPHWSPRCEKGENETTRANNRRGQRGVPDVTWLQHEIAHVVTINLKRRYLVISRCKLCSPSVVSRTNGWGPELCTATAHLVRPWLKPAGPAGRGLPLAADPLLPLPGGLPAHGPGPAGAHPCTPLHSRAHPLIPPKSYTPPYIPYGRLSASRAHFAGLSTGYRSKAAAPQSALLPRR